MYMCIYLSYMCIYMSLYYNFIYLYNFYTIFLKTWPLHAINALLGVSKNTDPL